VLPLSIPSVLATPPLYHNFFYPMATEHQEVLYVLLGDCYLQLREISNAAVCYERCRAINEENAASAQRLEEANKLQQGFTAEKAADEDVLSAVSRSARAHDSDEKQPGNESNDVRYEIDDDSVGGLTLQFPHTLREMRPSQANVLYASTPRTPQQPAGLQALALQQPSNPHSQQLLLAQMQSDTWSAGSSETPHNDSQQEMNIDGDDSDEPLERTLLCSSPWPLMRKGHAPFCNKESSSLAHVLGDWNEWGERKGERV
jgi:hypothetical protein